MTEMPGWVSKILEGYGLSGVVIFALSAAVVYLARLFVQMNRERMVEHEVMIKALEAVASSQRDGTRAAEERNSATKELSSVISRLGTAFEMMGQKIEFQSAFIRDKITDQKLVIDSLGEANRVNSGLLRDIRDKVNQE